MSETMSLEQLRKYAQINNIRGHWKYKTKKELYQYILQYSSYISMSEAEAVNKIKDNVISDINNIIKSYDNHLVDYNGFKGIKLVGNKEFTVEMDPPYELSPNTIYEEGEGTPRLMDSRRIYKDQEEQIFDGLLGLSKKYPGYTFGMAKSSSGQSIYSNPDYSE